MRVAPDAYFVLRQGDQRRHYFLETDRATEEHRRIVDKFVDYWWHLQDSRFADPRGGRPHVKVLSVMNGEQRMRNLQAVLQSLPEPNRSSHGGRGLFRFLLEDRFAVACSSVP